MHNSNCLNCNTQLNGKFCHECGQIGNTHRITAKHFLTHDLVHGVWHIDKGMFFTLKETFVRPGYAALDYIKGKRIKYYNIFYLILLTLGFMYVLAGRIEGGVIGNFEESDSAKKLVFDVIEKNVKLFYLLLLPMMALASTLLFRKLKFNFFEHLIIAGFTLLGMFIFILLGMLLTIPQNYYLDIVNNAVGIACLIFPAYVYFQATRQRISFPGYVFRILLFYGLLYGTVQLLVLLAIYMVSQLS